jgi:hypothetical protein
VQIFRRSKVHLWWGLSLITTNNSLHLYRGEATAHRIPDARFIR